jgi:hypothetical protein
MPSSQSWTSTENLVRPMPEATLNHIDSYSGLSNTLLLLINQTADLRREIQSLDSRPFDEIELKKIEEEAVRVNTAIKDLQQILPDWVSTADQALAINLQQTAEAYRLTAQVLLHESFVISLFRDDGNHKIQLLSPERKSAHIKAILNLVSEIISHSPVTMSWPLWPLFIAGCFSTSEDDKTLVLRLFDDAKMKSSLTVQTNCSLILSLTNFQI